MSSETSRALLHIGCGYGLEWQAGFPADLTAVVLLDPNPACIEYLRPRLASDPRIRLIEAAAAAQSGNCAFQLLTPEDFCCLSVPEALFALMPGLRLQRQITVACLDMADLLAEAGLSGGHNHLVLEALGAETRLLRDLIVSGGLDCFNAIRVHMARQPLHADALDPAGLADLLAEQGFRLQHTSDDADPDWPVLRFDRDAALFALRRETALLRRENDGLRERAEQAAVAHAQALSERDAGIATLQAKTLDLAARFSSLEAAASTEAARLSAEVRKWQDSREMVKDESARRLARAEDLEAQLAAVKAELKDETERLSAEVRKWQDSREMVKDESARRLARAEDLEAQLAAVKAQFADETTAQAERTATLLGDAAGREAGLQKDIAVLRNELSGEKVISQNTGQRVAALTAELDSLRAAQHATDTRAQAAQADLGLALRMQSLAASDMKDLQQRYAETLARKEDQDRLIAQLVVRLEEASEYLQKLALPASQSGLSNVQTAQTADLGRAQPVLAAKIKKMAKPGKVAKSDKSGKSGKAAR